MTPGKLLVELFRRGVRVEADGDRLRYSPRSRVTPELVELMRQHKPALIKSLGRVMFTPKPDTADTAPDPSGVYETPPVPRESAGSVSDYCNQRWEFSRSRAYQLMSAGVTIDKIKALEFSGGRPPDDARQPLVGAQHSEPDEDPAAVASDASGGADVWLEGDELPDLDPCECGSLELWESCGWPRRWRCVHCDPPTKARRLLETVAQIRARSPRTATKQVRQNVA